MARQELLAVYSRLASQPTSTAAGGKKPPEKPHDLEALTLDQMRIKVASLASMGRSQVASSGVVLQFLGAHK
jgi:hypothetical protein